MYRHEAPRVVRIVAYLGLAALFVGCSGAEFVAGDPGQGNDVPLSDYEQLFSGAPKNDSLPVEGKQDAVYPEASSELASVQSVVKSQGRRGVCSIFSTVAYMEHLYIKAGWDQPDFSEQYLQWSVKFQQEAFTHSSGSNAKSNLEAIHRFGIPREEAWPYEPDKWTEAQDPECSGDSMPTRCYTNGEPPAGAVQAKKFFLPEGRYISTRSIKHHIHTVGTGVVVGVDFFYQAWNHRRSTLPINPENWSQGIVLSPNSDDITESHEHRAGHSILLVGWDDRLEVAKRDRDGNVVVDDEGNPVTEKGFYIFKNSWGTSSFGRNHPVGPGYGYIAMQYIELHGSARVAGLPNAPGSGLTAQAMEASFSGVVAKDAWEYHTVQLGAGARDIRVAMTGEGDADLYTRFSARPTESSYDCRPYKISSQESCVHPSADGETLELGVRGWGEGNSYRIEVRWTL